MAKARTGQRVAKGRIFIVSAPSGCGKTTLCKRLVEGGLGLAQSVSMTTRLPRKDEKNGVDYFFVTKKRFDRIAAKNGFLEHESNFGYQYGTPKGFIESNIKAGRSVLLSIDVKGAMKVRRAYPAESVLVFILPPSVSELKKRLCARKSDGWEAIFTRLSLAKKEMSYKDKYDYRVVNDRLDAALRRLKRILASETGRITI